MTQHDEWAWDQFRECSEYDAVCSSCGTGSGVKDVHDMCVCFTCFCQQNSDARVSTGDYSDIHKWEGSQ